VGDKSNCLSGSFLFGAIMNDSPVSELLQVNSTTAVDSIPFASHSHGVEWKFPLLLSCLAGASTSVGAGIVFVLSPSRIQQSMPFSLSLAASVMITVSVISIGPECFEGVIEYDPSDGTRNVNATILFQRVLSFAGGCGSYYLLSRLLAALPEPESFISATANSTSSFKGGDVEDQQHLLLRHQPHSVPSTPYSEKHQDPHNSSTSKSNKKSTSPKDPRGNTTIRRVANRDTSPLISSLSGCRSGESVENGDDYSAASDDDDKRKTLTASSPTYSSSNDSNIISKKREKQHEERRRSWRVAMLLFVSLLCHNFPEGLAVVASTVESRELGVTVAVGILIHNIPEGIAIAVSCMAARPDAPWLAFGLASVSGLAEPMGAMVALSVLNNTTDSLPLENILACVAGIMCMVAAVELYPEAYRHVRHQQYTGMIYGTLVGILIMVATEWYLPL
jgi:ZIP family zinc transporter